MERLQGKNVLITGASSGIGQAIAVRFAAEGANIAINYRSGAEQAEATRAMAKAARSNGSGAFAVLTPTERELAYLLTSSLGLPEIARARNVSLNTVKSQVRSIYSKLGVSSREDAVELLQRPDE